MKNIYIGLMLISLFSCNRKESNKIVNLGSNPNQIQLNRAVHDTLRNAHPNKIFKNKMTDQELIENIKLAINPKFKDWVLFRNGTYIIFDDITKVKNIEDEAIAMMKEFGPVFAGGPAGDFNTIHLTKTEGWIVAGHGYGMYTYVSPSEMQNTSANDLEVGLFGRSKRDLDGKNPEIIYINKSK
ncbi:hypothetical protein [Chryseobacterium sp. Leaf201]|uniref:hypothetical protein n=1 Tax=Chryseobacterium sp. Leaf201 TaxID=1735672 RepID=UPI000A7F99C6|nr:hypothetical protein [Chryseobacterium sp. Leaf201]